MSERADDGKSPSPILVLSHTHTLLRTVPETLLHSLNTLLTSLHIPISLETPLDLTPSLILALFESTLRTRLPLPLATRQAKSHKGKVAAMKIVLGVLEDDVLGVDVGLENVDPRRLAEGKPDEVRYVGEVLCWLGRKLGYLEELSREDERPRMEVGPETSGSLSRSSWRERARAKATKNETSMDNDEDVFGPVRMPTTLSPSIASTSLDSSLLHHSAHTADDSHTAMSLHDALHEHEHEVDAQAQDVLADEPEAAVSEEHLDDLSILQPHRDTYSRRRDLTSDHALHSHDQRPAQDQTIDLDEVTAFLDSRAHLSRNTPQRLARSSKSHDTSTRRIRVPSRRCDGDSETELEQEESIEESFCRCSPKELPPPRRSGYIGMVDFEEELRSFEAQRRAQKTPSSAHLSRSISSRPRYPGLNHRTPIRTPNLATDGETTPTILTRHTSPSQYTLALLEERARLLEELARMKLEQTR